MMLPISLFSTVELIEEIIQKHTMSKYLYDVDLFALNAIDSSKRESVFIVTDDHRQRERIVDILGRINDNQFYYYMTTFECFDEIAQDFSISRSAKTTVLVSKTNGLVMKMNK